MPDTRPEQQNDYGDDAVDSGAFSRQLATSIRHFRDQSGISLSELSRRAGVAKGTLSRLEVGRGNPTIMTLAALARELDVTPSDFFTPEIEGSVAPPPLAGPVLDMRFLSRIRSDSIWEIYETVIPTCDEPLYSDTHGGIEHLFLLDGEARVGPVDAPVVLRPGEHTSFAGSEPHLYWSPNRPSRALLMMDYPLDND